MLNMKKGLAIVLAAATAFTFAPVANLGQAVTANATVTSQFTQQSDKSIELVAGEYKVFELKDMDKIDGVLSTDIVSASVDDKGIASLVSDTTPTAPTDADAVKTVADLSKTAIADTGLAAVKTANKIAVYGRNEGTTTLHFYTEDKNGEKRAEQTVTITVKKVIQSITFDKSDLKAKEQPSGDPKEDVTGGATSTTVTATYKNAVAVETGHKVVTTVKSGNDAVATAAMSATSGETGEFAAGSTPSTSKIVVSYKGVGSTSITVTEKLVDTTTNAEQTIATATISVTVDRTQDVLSVKFDGNRSGSQTETVAKAGQSSESHPSAQPKETDGITLATSVGYENGNTYALKSGGTAATAADWNMTKAAAVSAPTLYLDNNYKTAKINASDLIGRSVNFDSSNNLSVDNSGNVTLIDTSLNQVAQTTSSYVTVSVPMDKGVPALEVYIPVVISNKDTTSLSVTKSNKKLIAKTVGGSNITDKTTDADLETVYLSTKDKKSETLTVESNAGSGFISGAVYSNLAEAKKAGQLSDIVSYNNGTITASKSGTAVVRITARNSGNSYQNADVYFRVEVVTKSAANKITVTNSVINLSASNKTAQIDAKASVAATTLKYQIVDAEGSEKEAKSSDVTLDPAKGSLTYNTTNSGKVIVRVYGNETGDALAPDDVYVTVNYSSTLDASLLKVTSDKKVNLKVGETSQIVATGTAITYTSSDESVATVAKDGTVTAKAAGAAVITVASPADATHAAGTEFVTVIVSQEGSTVTKPAKVTGVKVTNLNGGKVKVTWTKQNQKNIKYYVKKTVGKKSSGKSVNGSKTTLTVKKGATVKVKVKAYIYDAAGKKLVGSYSTTVTKKTDKK